MIVIAGMIGIGKSSVAKVLGEEFGTDVFYESVEDNKVLPLFYGASDEEILGNRYPFLLQLWFLNTRFRDIKKALSDNNNVLDRSIYEDYLFAKSNFEMGRISDLEFEIYQDLLNNMLQELSELPKKSPDLMVYLKGDFDTVLKRIKMRGRSYELDESLIEYYKYIWERYDEWVYDQYEASHVLTIDMNKTDVVNNDKDRKRVIREVKKKLKEIRGNK